MKKINDDANYDDNYTNADDPFTCFAAHISGNHKNPKNKFQEPNKLRKP